MIGVIAREELENLRDGRSKTVMILNERDAEVNWKEYLAFKGGAVRVQISEISDDEWKVRNWQHQDVFGTKGGADHGDTPETSAQAADALPGAEGGGRA